MPALWSAPTGRSTLHPSFRTPSCKHLLSAAQRRAGRRRAVHISCKVADFSAVAYDRVVTLGFATNFDELYESGSLLGAGSFGTVHTVTHKVNGNRYAVKTMPKTFTGKYLKEQFVTRILHEVDVYSHLGRSLNIAHLYGVFEDARSVSLVMELCTGGELWRRIKKGRYSEKDAAKIIRQVLQSVAQCHSRGVMVRDVKPENFLFLNDSEDAPLKMIDFGLAEYCRPGQFLNKRVGTPIYLAPEVLRMNYTLSADVWSAGIIAYQLLTGRLPFKGEDGIQESQISNSKYDHKELFRAILYAELDFHRPPWNTISREAKDLVQSLLQRDPFKRPSAEEALNNCWLRDNQHACSSDRPLCDTLVQRLQRFGTYGKLKQVALKEVATLIPAESDHPRIRSLQDAFSVLDGSGVGRLPYSRLMALMRENGYELTDTEVHQLLDQFDLDEDGTVDYREWLAALLDWKDLQGSSQWNQWVDIVFHTWDADHSGNIGRSDLVSVLCGEECPIEDTVGAALREADQDHDGSISREEFSDLLHVDAKESLDLYSNRQRRVRLTAPDAVEGPEPVVAQRPLSTVLAPKLAADTGALLTPQGGHTLNLVLEPNTMDMTQTTAD